MSSCDHIFFLSACILFKLVCILHVILFEGYNELFERDEDALVYMEEYVRICDNLSKISDRFYILVLLLILIVISSEFVSISWTAGYGGRVICTNAG